MLLRDLGYFNYWFFIIIHLFDLFYHTIFYLMIQQLILFDNYNLVFFPFLFSFLPLSVELTFSVTIKLNKIE